MKIYFHEGPLTVHVSLTSPTLSTVVVDVAFLSVYVTLRRGSVFHSDDKLSTKLVIIIVLR